MTFTRSLRFLIGAALVAGGLQLVGPLAMKLAAVGRSAAGETARPGPSALVAPGAPVVSGVPVAPPVAPPSATLGLRPDPAWEPAAEVAAPDSAGGLQWDRAPPPPPAPLPALPSEFAQAAPAFGAAYRSTLRVPPPDLLDAAAPPPRGPWDAPDPAAPDRAPPFIPGNAVAPPSNAADLTVPATYRVRDGDDLTTIAGRFYGHPAAASAIWAANREAIPNPEVLPIGTELRLPPAWAAAPHRTATGAALEPIAYARPGAAASSQHAGAAVGGAPWLAPSPASPPSAGTAPAAPGIGATSVRIGPGETLATLARRLYGDPAMAAEIFAVNRDRLRSPDLVVAGMELRLPRPVTAPPS